MNEKLTPEQRAQIELCGDLKDPVPGSDEVFDYYGGEITFAEMTEQFRKEYGDGPSNTYRRYHVTYSYQATGMDRADRRDLGIVEAVSADAAITYFVRHERPEDRAFVRGCLTARRLSD